MHDYIIELDSNLEYLLLERSCLGKTEPHKLLYQDIGCLGLSRPTLTRHHAALVLPLMHHGLVGGICHCEDVWGQVTARGVAIKLRVLQCKRQKCAFL